MKALPDFVRAYKKTPIFDAANVPQGILNNHSTKEGVWGLIQVQSGTLEYTIEDNEVYILDVETNGVVEPMVVHHVKPLSDDTEFFVEFYK